MNCPKCGAPIREYAAFCTACGSPVERKRSRLKSTIPITEQPPAEPTPPVTPERVPAETAGPVETAAPRPAAPAEPAAPTPEPVASSVYDAVERTAGYASVPKPEPRSSAEPTPEPREKGAKLITVLHTIRAYLAVLLAVVSLVLLFFPWFSTGVEVEVYDVEIDGKTYDLTFGDLDVERNVRFGTPLSILDIVQFRDVTELADLKLEDESAAKALKDSGSSARERIRSYLAVPSDVRLGERLQLPTGVLAMAPQLVCILLMAVFFIIGAIRVFAADPFPDGAPKTGWLKAGGIVGVVMSVITGIEVFVIDQFFAQLVERMQSADFDGDIDLCVKLMLAYVLFAVVSVALVLLATHWGGGKKRARGA